MPEGCLTVSCCLPGPFDFETVPRTGVYLHITVDPEDGGTVTGEDTYTLNEGVTVTATPAALHSFVGWFTEGDSLLSTDASYTFSILGNTTLIAKFELS